MNTQNFNDFDKNVFLTCTYSVLFVLYFGIFSIANVIKVEWNVSIKITIFAIVSLYYLYATEKLIKNFGIVLLSYFLIIPVLAYIKYSYLIMLCILLCIWFVENKDVFLFKKLKLYDWSRSLFLIVILLFSFIFAAIIYSASSFGYGDFFIPIRLKTFMLSRDTLFHIALGKMFDNYGVFSTGIHGNVPIKYHLYSHLLYWSISKILNIDLIYMYGQGTWVIFGPLFIYALLKVSQTFCNPDKFLHFIFMSLVLIFNLNYFVGNMPGLFIPFLFGGLWGFLFLESQMIGITILMGFLYFIFNIKKINTFNYFWIILYLFVLTLTKISIGAMSALFVGCIIFLGLEIPLFKRLIYNVGICVYWFLIYKIFFVSEVATSLISYKFLSFFAQDYYKAITYIFYEYIHFWVIILFLLLFRMFSKLSKLHKSYLLTIFISMIVGYIMLDLASGAGILWYFADVVKFFCYPFVYYLFFQGFTQWDKHRWFKIITMILIIINLFFVPYQIYRRFEIIKAFNNVFLIKLENPIEYLETLHKITNAPKDYMIYIPATEYEYWRKLCKDSPFYIPAITGRPALFGHPKNCFELTYGYGYFYKDYEALQLAHRKILSKDIICHACKELGFKGYFFITKHKYYKEDCL